MTKVINTHDCTPYECAANHLDQANEEIRMASLHLRSVGPVQLAVILEAVAQSVERTANAVRKQPYSD